LKFYLKKREQKAADAFRIFYINGANKHTVL